MKKDLKELTKQLEQAEQNTNEKYYYLTTNIESLHKYSNSF